MSPSTNFDGSLITANLCVIGFLKMVCFIVETRPSLVVGRMCKITRPIGFDEVLGAIACRAIKN